MNTLERQYGTLFSYEEGTFFEKLRKDEKEMKKVKIFLGAFLCMNFLTMSGCDKVVYSAVVEEKDKTDSKTEEHKEKETVQKTVAEQVQAPEKYQTIIQSDLRTAERTDQKSAGSSQTKSGRVYDHYRKYAGRAPCDRQLYNDPVRKYQCMENVSNAETKDWGMRLFAEPW